MKYNLKTLTKTSAALIALLGFLVMTGWLFDISVLKSVFPNFVSMKPNAALCFMLSGWALWLLNTDNPSSLQKIIIFSCFTLILLIGMLTLGEYVFGINFPVDEFLFEDNTVQIGTSHPGRMAPITAFNFILVGIVLFSHYYHWKHYKVTQFSILLLFAISLIAFCGYLYDAEKLYGIQSYTKMALHTSIAFLILSGGLLTTIGDKGVMDLLNSQTSGGFVSRNLIPIITVLIVVTGWLRFQGEKFGLYETPFGNGFSTVLNVAILMLIIFKIGEKLMIEEKERAYQYEEKEKRAEELFIANKKLLHQNEEKEKRAAELSLINKELADYKFAFDKSCILSITNQSGNIIYVNDYFCDISKYSREELIGQNHRIVNSGYHTKYFFRKLWTTISNGEIWRGEVKSKAKDGTMYWAATTIIPFLDEDGKPFQYFATRIDITELKKAEEALEKSQYQFQNLIENISGLYWILDPQTYQGIYISPSYETLWGRKCEYYYKDPSDFLHAVHPDDRDSLMADYKNIGKVNQLESTYRIIKPDGEIRWYNSRLKVVPDAKGYKKVYGYSEDITERKNSEQALEKSEEKYRTLFDTTNDAVMLFNDTGFFDCNPETLKIFGISSKEEFLFKHPAQLSPPTQPSGIDSMTLATVHLNRAMEKGSDRFEWVHLRINTGEIFPAEVLLSRMEIEGLPVLQATVRDITERKKAEEKLKQHLHVLETQNTQLTDFTYIISHNLRGPLVNIGLLVEYIENSTDEAEQKDLFDKIKQVVNTINDTFNELVESLQVKFDTEIKSEKITIQDAVKKAMATLEFEINSSDAVIEINTKATPVIYFPEKYMDSILFNLISNSLKYKAPDRKPIISIKTEKREHSTLLSISDNGLGIDLKMHQNQLFKIRKVFHKHPDAKGFGLFMTKTQVEAMGGRIWVESKPDAGSTFFIEFVNQNI